ncbi:MAG: S49 family peptidase [Trueperaceae bacterium]
MKLDLTTLRAPWALHPDHVPALLNLARDGQQNQARAGDPVKPEGGRVAVVPIHGPIFNRDGFAAWLGLPTYQGITATVNALANDSKTEEIILSFDSPGGVALNTDEAAHAIREAARVKPVRAVANGYMASAAYWLASQATEIVTTPLSAVGSIGVITMHADYSRLLEEKGIDVKVYRTGEMKGLGQAVDPNDELMQTRVGKELAGILDLFAVDVAAGRGLTREEVLARYALDSDHESALRGSTVLGAEAVRLGLADRVATFTEVTHEATARLKNRSGRRALAQKGPPTMNELLARLGLTEDATAEEVAAALATLEEQAATRTNAQVAKALGVDAATPAALAAVKAEAADGRRYRADLLTRLHAATIRTEGNTPEGVAAADRAKRIFASAEMNDLTAEVQRLEAKAANVVPTEQVSKTTETDADGAKPRVSYEGN